MKCIETKDSYDNVDCYFNDLLTLILDEVRYITKMDLIQSHDRVEFKLLESLLGKLNPLCESIQTIARFSDGM